MSPVLEKPKRHRRTKAEMEAFRAQQALQPQKKKRTRRTKAQMEAYRASLGQIAPPTTAKTKKKDIKDHIVLQTADYLMDTMDAFNKQYYAREAKRRNYPTKSYVAVCLLGYFGIQHINQDKELMEYILSTKNT